MTDTNNRRRADRIKLTATIHDARPVLRRQAQDWAEGFPSASGGPGTSGGGISKPTEHRATRPAEGAGLASACADAADAVDAWFAEGQRLGLRIASLLPLSHPVAEMLVRHATVKRGLGEGVCQCCKRQVAGTDEDRLRSGWCAACYHRWLRAGRPDRARFNATGCDEDAGDNSCNTLVVPIAATS